MAVRKKFNAARDLDIVRMRKEGVKVAALAEKFNVTESRILQIVKEAAVRESKAATQGKPGER